jgi:hypothetical protein
MGTLLINALFYFGLGIIWIHSEPIILLKRFLSFKEEEYDNYSKTKQFIHRGIHCLQCSSLWITWIFSGSFTLAVIVSLLAYLWDNRHS